MSEEHLRQLAWARQAGRKVHRAAGVARFDAWTIAIFGVLTFLFGITDPPSAALGLAMGAVAFVEFRGCARLRALDSRAARTLGINQLVLASALIAYALWRLHVEMNGPGPFAEYKAVDPGIADMLKPYEGWVLQITKLVYLGIIVIALCAQGGMAVYYFTRRKHIDAYRAQAPQWILDLQRAGVTI
jgi:hypothetical protein